MRAGEEAGGDVGEGVGMQAALEQRQHLRGEAAGAGADFEDAQAAAFRQLRAPLPAPRRRWPPASGW